MIRFDTFIFDYDTKIVIIFNFNCKDSVFFKSRDILTKNLFLLLGWIRSVK